MPHLLLRLEGGVIFAASVLAYFREDGSWILFAVLLLSPDLSMLGYLAGLGPGSVAYNLAHTYVWPVVLLPLSVFGDWALGTQLALIWLVHIGVDRLLGYGLKYPTGFKDTHLQRV